MTRKTDAPFSFWQLINRYKIEIPIIQRDYAQGRKDGKAKDIREKIISRIFEALSGGKALSFDFVYGRVADGVFVPIDGQQRLTTLWLLHLYLFKRCMFDHREACGKACPNFDAGILSRFTYLTRQSSREFCRALVENDIIPESASQEFPIENYIVDQSWFWPEWKADPTVAGMLRTLDEVHKQFNEKKPRPNTAEMLERLLADSSQCPITFKFLDMGTHDLSDDLYLKMNARGLSLNAWENFKAQLEQWLEDFCEKNEAPDWLKVKEFLAKLDKEWLDFFWTEFSGESDHSRPERHMLGVFRRHFLNVWEHTSPVEKDVANEEPIKEGSDKEGSNSPTQMEEVSGKQVRVVSDKQGNNIYESLRHVVSGDFFTPFSVYKSVLDHCKLEESIRPIINLFDALGLKQIDGIDTAPAWDKENMWDPLNGEDTTFASRVRFYAVMKCFAKPITDDKATFEAKYEAWMRVVWNVLEDATIDKDNYFSALKLIDELGDHWDDITNWLADPDMEIKSGLVKFQVVEEKKKAKLLVADAEKWKQLVDQGEGHYMLRGSLRFLMHEDGWQQKFDARLRRFLELCGDTDSKQKRVSVFRAFVSQFDEWKLFWHGLKYDASSDTWRNVLRGAVRDEGVRNGWFGSLCRVLDSEQEPCKDLRDWSGSQSLLPDTSNEKLKTACNVLVRTNVIGECKENSELRELQYSYFLLPYGRGHHVDSKRTVVLDKRQMELSRLTKQDQVFKKLDSNFEWKGKRYVWWRDGKIYARKDDGQPDKSQRFVVNDNGDLEPVPEPENKEQQL